MKKSIALVLAIILLIGIIGIALADCSHNNWHTVNSALAGTGYAQHSCKCSNDNTHNHMHWRKVFYTKTTYLCFSCGAIKNVITSSVGVIDHCSLVDPIH